MGKQAVDKMKDERVDRQGRRGRAKKLGGGDDGGGRQEDAPAADSALHRRGGSGREGVQAWIDFEKFPQFMHRVLSVQKDGNTKSSGARRSGSARASGKADHRSAKERQRIAWKTTSGTQHRASSASTRSATT